MRRKSSRHYNLMSMQTVFHEASTRGYVKHGWLTTHHSFSFASYYDPERMGFGALRVLNDDTIAPGTGFGKHPHENMEIITIPLLGALKHEDSLGNSAVIETGEVQVMSAGTGVEHAEYNASQTENLSLLQIWILSNAPAVTPRYEQQRFDLAAHDNIFLPVVGSIGEPGVLGIHQAARISLGRFEAGYDGAYQLQAPDRGVYFFVITGVISVASKQLQIRDALGVWDTGMVSLHADQEAFLLAIEVPMTKF